MALIICASSVGGICVDTDVRGDDFLHPLVGEKLLNVSMGE